MQIDMNALIVKSTSDNYNAEKKEAYEKGAKRNTYRFVEQKEHEELKNSSLDFIVIENTESGESFNRKLLDYRPFEYEKNKWLWIFSW